MKIRFIYDEVFNVFVVALFFKNYLTLTSVFIFSNSFQDFLPLCTGLNFPVQNPDISAKYCTIISAHIASVPGYLFTESDEPKILKNCFTSHHK